MAAQPGDEPTIRHIQFDENGDEVTDLGDLQTTNQEQQETGDDDREEVRVGSATKRRKKKGSTSKSRKSSNSPFLPTGLQGPGHRVRALSKLSKASKKKDKNVNQIAHATADYLFAKQQASDSFKLPNIPAELYDELKKSPVIVVR